MTPSIPNVLLPNGRKMPIIGLGTFQGCFQVDRENVRAALEFALECGYRHIDTAAIYNNEAALGDVFHRWLSSGRLRRDELFVTTKLPMIANRAGDVSRFLDRSLKDLQLSFVDLYLIHNPVGFKGKDDDDTMPKDDEGNIILDMDTNLETLYQAMEEQVDLGKAKAIGLSNFNSNQIERIMKVCRMRPANLQIEIHAYHQQRELRSICSKYGIPVCAFAPIAAPYKGKRLEDEPLLLEHPTVTSLATQIQRTPAQVLIRFLIQKGVIVIPKSSKPSRIKENFEVFDFELSPSDMLALESLDKGNRGRIFIFTDVFKGISKHPEYTFSIPF